MDFFLEHAQSIGLVFFFSVFVGICVFVMRPSVKDSLNALSKIPLKEE